MHKETQLRDQNKKIHCFKEAEPRCHVTAINKETELMICLVDLRNVKGRKLPTPHGLKYDVFKRSHTFRTPKSLKMEKRS